MSSPSYRYTEYGYDKPFNQRLNIPIQQLSNNVRYNVNEQHVQHRIQHNDMTIQWINDPMTGGEKFRVTIHIAGFNQNEVNIRVDGTTLFIYGEHIENKSQGTSKKIIEKSYDLPSDVDGSRPHVTFPIPTTMQVDFPSRHSNTTINYDRNSSRHSPSRFTQPTRYISTQKLDRGVSNIIPVIRTQSPFDELPDISPSSIYFSTNDNYYRSNNHQNAIDRRYLPLSIARSNSPIYQYRESNQTGLQTEYQRPDSPTLSNDNGVRSNFKFGRRSITPPLSDYNKNKSSIFPEDFDSNIFYRSPFQPQIFTDDRDQRYIEMKLDVHDGNPDEINVSINDNDLIVHNKHTNFYKKITLPSNTDLTSLSLQYHHDKKLYITAKLLDEYSSLKYI